MKTKGDGMNKMIVYVLFLHRTEWYPGEYAPETVGSITEFLLDELDYNPLEEKRDELLEKDPSIGKFAILPIEVCQDEIKERIHQAKPLKYSNVG